MIDDNNGIKHASFASLVLVCGCPPDELDSALIVALDSYGKARGAVAHKDLRYISTLKAPSAEKSDAVLLLKNIDVFFASMTKV